MLPLRLAPRLTLLASIAGCAATSTGARNDAALAALHGDSSRRQEVARLITERENAETRAAASVQLAAEGYEIRRSPAWRNRTRAEIAEANRRIGITPTAAQFEAQVDQYRDEVLMRLLAAMVPVGGVEVIAFCTELAGDERAKPAVRKAALLVLSRHLDRADVAGRARAAELWDRVEAAQQAPRPSEPGSVANASTVVAAMTPAFRRCYAEALKRDPSERGSIRITARIGASGEVTSVSPSGHGLSPETASCVAAVVAKAIFAPPEGGGATIVIPVTFVAVDPPSPKLAPSNP